MLSIETPAASVSVTAPSTGSLSLAILEPCTAGELLKPAGVLKESL